MTAKEPAWRRYTRFWGSRVDADVDDELAFHAEMRARDYRDRGLDDDAARAAALTRLGDLSDTRAACLTIGHRRQRRVTRIHTVDAFIQDLRYALRTLGRQAAWTTVAVLTLGIGIGAATAMFGVVNSLILRPLPYRDADRVMMVWRVQAKSGLMISSAEDILKGWNDNVHSVEAIEPYNSGEMTLSGRGDAAQVQVAAVRSSFFAFTGIAPIRGRGFLPEESRPGGTHVALISEAMWRTRFGGDNNVLGRTLTLDDRPYTIVGVANGKLRLPATMQSSTDIWLALGADSIRFNRAVVARLRPGATPELAAKELDTLAARVRTTEWRLNNYETRLVRPGEMVGFRSSLYLLAGAVALLLVIACANVAHLLLARAATRERELAIRVALGAGRSRLIRQLLTESSVLAAFGCAAGMAIGYASIRALLALRPPSLAQLATAELDGRAFAVSIGVSLATGLLFGCAAAIHAVRRSTGDALRTTSASGAVRHSTQRLRSFLVVTEMAMSAMLLVGAALVVRSVANLRHVEPGFDTRDLYTMTVVLPQRRYASPGERAAFGDALVNRARSLGSVTGAALAQGAPPDVGGYIMSQLDAQDMAPREKTQFFAYNAVSPEYFDVLRMKFVAGRGFGATSLAQHEAIINEWMAKNYWPGQTAVGRHIRFGAAANAGDWLTVVGVVGDVPMRGLAQDRDQPLVYLPRDPADVPAKVMIALRARPGQNPVASLRAATQSLDRNLVPPIVRSADDALSDSISSYRFTMTLLGAFAGLALVLSAIGLYGVIAYVVTQRQREIGIRIALGARPRHVARAIVARGLVLSAIGLALGLGIAKSGAKILQTSLYGVTGADPLSYVAAALLLIAISVLACVVPMRRAMSVDPAITMRGD